METLNFPLIFVCYKTVQLPCSEASGTIGFYQQQLGSLQRQFEGITPDIQYKTVIYMSIVVFEVNIPTPSIVRQCSDGGSGIQVQGK